MSADPNPAVDTQERDRRNVTLALVHVALAVGILALFVWRLASGH